jgi:CRP-like cAMP-binding protein
MDFTNFIGVEPSVCDDLLSKARQRIIEKTASHIDLFSGFNKKTLELLAHVSYLRSVPPNTAIFREGDENADFFYLIVEGQVGVWQKKCEAEVETVVTHKHESSLAFTFSCWISSHAAESESVLGEAPPEAFKDSEHLCNLHAKQYFGEIALVSDLPRTATVATGNEMCTLLEFNKRDFISIFTHDRISLAELEIRLLAEKTRLCHILLHPAGQQLFHDFLCSEYSQESVDFWKDAERFRSVFTSSNRISTQSLQNDSKTDKKKMEGQSGNFRVQKKTSAQRPETRANMEQEATQIFDKVVSW